jgi:hypothetical protein
VLCLRLRRLALFLQLLLLRVLPQVLFRLWVSLQLVLLQLRLRVLSLQRVRHLQRRVSRVSVLKNI